MTSRRTTTLIDEEGNITRVEGLVSFDKGILSVAGYRMGTPSTSYYAEFTNVKLERMLTPMMIEFVASELVTSGIGEAPKYYKIRIE